MIVNQPGVGRVLRPANATFPNRVRPSHGWVVGVNWGVVFTDPSTAYLTWIYETAAGQFRTYQYGGGNQYQAFAWFEGVTDNLTPSSNPLSWALCGGLLGGRLFNAAVRPTGVVTGAF